MPYISEEDKAKFDKSLDQLNEINSSGELNYLLTKVCLNYLKNKELKYQYINDIVGALEGAKLEFSDRIIRDYEDLKIRVNGDVYEGKSSNTNLAWAGGFFEGEGCFYAHYYKPRQDGSQVFRLQASVVQKDKRILDQFQNVTKLGIVYGPDKRGIYCWKARNNKEAKELFYLLRPFLGQRRQETAMKIMAEEIQQIFRPKKTHCKRGHLYTEINTTIRENKNYSYRRCKDCQKEDNDKRRKT